MTVFRRLREVGYRTSFTHRGQYYTLAERPEFDASGLWFHGDIGFSRSGTLKETTAVPVTEPRPSSSKPAWMLTQAPPERRKNSRPMTLERGKPTWHKIAWTKAMSSW
jgi:hypothetical protein